MVMKINTDYLDRCIETLESAYGLLSRHARRTTSPTAYTVPLA